MSDESTGEEPQLDPEDRAQRRTLLWVLLINLAQGIIVGIVGLFAQSTGLLGAALDNLADACVYGVSLYAVGRNVQAKSVAAYLSGSLLILLGIGLLIEVMRRFFAGGDPIGLAMIVTAIANAAVNVLCLWLLQPHRKEGVHLTASWIFTTNDTLANVGIVLSGIAVMVFGSAVPDLVIGVIIACIVVKGGWEILERASKAKSTDHAA